MVLELPPFEFHQIEFRAVRWQKDQGQTLLPPALTVLSDIFAGMDAGPVSDDDGRTGRISVFGQGIQERHDVLTGGVPFDFTVLDFACREVHAAHQIEPGSDPTCFGGRNFHWTPDRTPGVGVRLGQPDRRFIQKQHGIEIVQRPLFTDSRSALKASFSAGSACPATTYRVRCQLIPICRSPFRSAVRLRVTPKCS